MNIKFNKYNVTNGEIKVRIFYSLDNQASQRKCVTLYAKDYGHALRKIFANEYENNSDIRDDYIETGLVRLFEDHPLYSIARKRAEAK